jgi:hypothetical protein
VDGYKGRLTDNYFDLEPGIEKTISFAKAELKNNKVTIKVKSLYDVVGK